MKAAYSLLPLLFFGLLACSDRETPKDVPFALMPDGLKKKIEAELIEKMKNEIIQNHIELDHFYRTYVPPTCGLVERRNLFELRRNTSNQIMVQGAINPKESIEELIKSYYLVNETLSPGQTRAFIQDYDYEFFDYPFYSSVTKDQINQEIEKYGIELQEALMNNDAEFIDFYSKQLIDWKNRLEAINVLDIEGLKEVHRSAHIRIFDQLNKEGLSVLVTNAIKGIIQVRDYASKKYFEISYMDLYFQGTRNNDPLAEKRLAAIDFIFPARIIDESYADLNDLLTDWHWEEEPEFVE